VPQFQTRYPLSSELLEIALADSAGVALCGRSAEIAALREVGRRDPSLGRVYEGHLNAAQLVARYGNAEQRTTLSQDILAGHLFAVWNTQDAERLRIVEIDGRYRLSGAKTWTSGAGSISRALVTAAWPDDTLQMCLVPMDRVSTQIDRSQWQPLGMQGSDTFRVDFTGVELTSASVIGQPNDYERQPWFFGGALRFLAVHTWIVERLIAETMAYLHERGRSADVFQNVRAAHMRIAALTCRCWLREGVDAWLRFDGDESEAHAASVIEIVDMARVAVERAALDVIEAAVRSVGAHGLIEPFPISRLVRDLQMYLRQPAPDAVLLRVGAAAFRCATAAQRASVASSTDTIP
jgi:alkylation response protein AidB-like acyl-CoA dehydrogenase